MNLIIKKILSDLTTLWQSYWHRARPEAVDKITPPYLPPQHWDS